MNSLELIFMLEPVNEQFLREVCVLFDIYHRSLADIFGRSSDKQFHGQ